VPFTPKLWENRPSHATPLDAAGLIDLETRLSDYSDSRGGSQSISLGILNGVETLVTLGYPDIVAHSGVLTGDVALTITGLGSTPSRIEITALQDSAGGHSMTVNDGSGAVVVPIPTTSSAAFHISALWDGTDLWIDVVGGGSGGGSGGADEVPDLTADTFQPFKIITFSDGTVRAIPTSATPPPVPTGLAVVPHVASANLTWTSTPGATSYKVLRNGSVIATVSAPKYRDGAVVTGSTYTWTLQAVDGYGQRSPQTTGVTAFIDPALNVAPAISVTAWPPIASTNGKTLLRVNGYDVDAQTLAYALTVDVGSVTATEDPSVWMYTP